FKIVPDEVGLGKCPKCGEDGDDHDVRSSPPSCPTKVERRFPMSLTVANLALILRALARVDDEDVSDATTLGDELTNVDAMYKSGMTEDEIKTVMDKGS